MPLVCPVRALGILVLPKLTVRVSKFMHPAREYIYTAIISINKDTSIRDSIEAFRKPTRVVTRLILVHGYTHRLPRALSIDRS